MNLAQQDLLGRGQIATFRVGGEKTSKEWEVISASGLSPSGTAELAILSELVYNSKRIAISRRDVALFPMEFEVNLDKERNRVCCE